MDVGTLLRGLGLERYDQAFRDNDVDAEVLPELTDEHLRELGLPLGPRLKLLKAIDALRDRSAPAGEPLPAGAAQAARGEVRSPPTGAVPRSPEAERRQLTVLFCDLVGSTELAARLDPEDLREVIGAYHRRVAKVIGRFEGHVAKYMGDGVLAYFGYPKAHEDDAERAVRAGLELNEAIGRLAPRPGLALQVRIGIATGL
ncbi:MAG TPA: adenylate/guanylate cyclase domain-containing protein, partial [Microvirga sp.]|nr:adenylate/guanylate cyclase domain-containing protein [Microvirga sp.]